MARGLMRHVEGTARQPVAPYTQMGTTLVFVKSDGTAATEDDIEAYEKKTDEYAQRQGMVMDQILRTLSDNVASAIRAHDPHKPSDFWK